MDQFFNGIEAFLTALKTKAVDVEKKGAEALRKIADWLDAQTGGKMGATPDKARLAACKADIATLVPTVSGAGIGMSGGIIAAILAFIKSILDPM